MTQISQVQPFPLNRGLFQLSGPDALRYLNGQVTQQLETIEQEMVLSALLTDAKSKIICDLGIRISPAKDIIIDCPKDLKEAAMERLDRYLIADEAEWKDLPDVCLSYSSETSPEHPDLSYRYGAPGYEGLVPTDAPNPLPKNHSSLLKLIRLEHELPAFRIEYLPGDLAFGAGVEDSAISYHKGCYLGQEIISRMKRARKAPFAIAVLSSPLLLPEGASLYDENEIEIGTVTTSHPHSEKALARINRKGAQSSTVYYKNGPESQKIQVHIIKVKY